MTLAPLSYSLVIMMKDKIYGVRDAYGNRPLCIGKIVPVDSGHREFHSFFLNIFSNVIFQIFSIYKWKLSFRTGTVEEVDAEGWVMSSESCGFLSIGARYVREVRCSNRFDIVIHDFFDTNDSHSKRLNLEKLSKLQSTVSNRLILLNVLKIVNSHFVFLNMFILHVRIQFSRDKWSIR